MSQLPRRFMKVLILLVVWNMLFGAALWHYLAKYSEHGLLFSVPLWATKRIDATAAYSVYIHKTQINPHGTIWKRVSGPGYISAFPINSPFRSSFEPEKEGTK